MFIARLISVFLLTTTNETTYFDLKFLSKYQALRTNPKIIFKKDLYKDKFDALLKVIEFLSDKNLLGQGVSLQSLLSDDLPWHNQKLVLSHSRVLS